MTNIFSDLIVIVQQDQKNFDTVTLLLFIPRKSQENEEDPFFSIYYNEIGTCFDVAISIPITVKSTPNPTNPHRLIISVPLQNPTELKWYRWLAQSQSWFHHFEESSLWGTSLEKIFKWHVTFSTQETGKHYWNLGLFVSALGRWIFPYQTSVFLSIEETWACLMWPGTKSQHMKLNYTNLDLQIFSTQK